MTLEELKVLSIIPDRDFTYAISPRAEVMVQLLPELFALWVAAMEDYGHCEPWKTMAALETLNSKAEGIKL